MNYDFINGEVLFIDKPLTWTSFDVVNKIRMLITKKINKKIKVGHAGTLDPLASGLVILCTGKKTKEISNFLNLDKEYITTIQFGATTPSFDLETGIDNRFPFEHINLELFKEVLTTFIGEQEQIPPIFSAKKINGKRAYIEARKGEKPPLDFVQPEQFANWYHPYYRIANNYCVQFELRGGLTFPVLESEDETEKIRLQNLNDLIGLKDRWRTRLGHIVRTTIKQLRKANFASLEAKLLEMADSKACEIGDLPFGILHAGYLKFACEGCELLLEELRKELVNK